MTAERRGFRRAARRRGRFEVRSSVVAARVSAGRRRYERSALRARASTTPTTIAPPPIAVSPAMSPPVKGSELLFPAAAFSPRTLLGAVVATFSGATLVDGQVVPGYGHVSAARAAQAVAGSASANSATAKTTIQRTRVMCAPPPA